MPYRNQADRKKHIDAWRATHVLQISAYNRKYYRDNRAEIRQRRDALRLQRESERQARRERVADNPNLMPWVQQRELEGGSPLGGRPGPAEATKRGEVRWMDRALRGTTYERKKPGRPIMYLGNRRQRHAAAQAVYAAKHSQRTQPSESNP